MNTLYNGDMLDILKTLPENSISTCITDPPYHLTSIVKRFGGENAAPAKYGTDGVFSRASQGFMGQSWDGGDIAFQPETWAAVYRVLKPGAYLLAFGGTRTFHRMVCAVEDAGFIPVDTIVWAHGQGFPKALSVSGAIDKRIAKNWDNICKGIDSLSISDIINKWEKNCDIVSIVEKKSEKSQTETGTNMQRKSIVPESVLLKLDPEKSCVSALIAELNSIEAHLMLEELFTVQKNVGQNTEQHGLSVY